MFASLNLNKSVILALCMIVLASASQPHHEEKADGPKSFPMIMWQRSSDAPTSEISDSIKTPAAISSIQSFATVRYLSYLIYYNLQSANAQNVLVIFKEGLCTRKLSKEANGLPYLKSKVVSSANVFTSIQDEFTFTQLNEVISSSNYHLGNITELEALKDFFTETIKESSNVRSFLNPYSILDLSLLNLSTRLELN